MRVSIHRPISAGLTVLMTALSCATGLAGPPQVATAATPASATNQIVAPQYVYSYAIKFVCGYQPPIQITTAANSYTEPPVKPGNYATEINIFNPQFKELGLRKRFITLVRNGKAVKEPESVTHVMTATMVLRSGYATMDDCDLLWKMTQLAPPVPPANSLLIGYLVINSLQELDIDAVYTSAAVRVGQTPGQPQTIESENVSIDVERIPAKRVQFNPNHFASGAQNP